MDSINHVSDPPTVAQEKADRLAQRDKIAALFRLSPLQDIEPETLRLVTPHYQQRISEIRRQLGMRLVNVPRSREDGATGTIRRQDGAYRFEPHESLDRDAGAVVAQGWSTKHGKPFQEEFRLRP